MAVISLTPERPHSLLKSGAGDSLTATCAGLADTSGSPSIADDCDTAQASFTSTGPNPAPCPGRPRRRRRRSAGRRRPLFAGASEVRPESGGAGACIPHGVGSLSELESRTGLPPQCDIRMSEPTLMLLQNSRTGVEAQYSNRNQGHHGSFLPRQVRRQIKIAPTLFRSEFLYSLRTRRRHARNAALSGRTTSREKLINIGANLVRHGRCVTVQLAEVAVPRRLLAEILQLIDDLPAEVSFDMTPRRLRFGRVEPTGAGFFGTCRTVVFSHPNVPPDVDSDAPLWPTAQPRNRHEWPRFGSMLECAQRRSGPHMDEASTIFSARPSLEPSRVDQGKEPSRTTSPKISRSPWGLRSLRCFDLRRLCPAPPRPTTRFDGTPSSQGIRVFAKQMAFWGTESTPVELASTRLSPGNRPGGSIARQARNMIVIQGAQLALGKGIEA